MRYLNIAAVMFFLLLEFVAPASGTQSPIPALTEGDKIKAKEIALNDPTVQEITSHSAPQIAQPAQCSAPRCR
jgi:hypothetical protein